MDSKKQSEIEKKYWEGTSSTAEEQALLASSLEGVEEKERTHFQQLSQFRKLSLDADFDTSFMEDLEEETTPVIQLIPSLVWKIAATVLIAFSFYFLYSPTSVVVETPVIAANLEEDPEKAFEITKQALLLISAKLNKASEVNVALNKFETTKNKIEKRQ